ncbi:MAG: F0F1 ATP synthase subunit A [Planctomycetes bacterium]|nr:F0F1 ATP synthase subunit A [Planctomycetota bacterium]
MAEDSGAQREADVPAMREVTAESVDGGRVDGTAHDGTAHDGTAHDGTAHDGTASHDALAHGAPSQGGSDHAGHGDLLSAESLMSHVKDAEYFHVPRYFSPNRDGIIKIPQLRESTEPIVEIKTGVPLLDELIEPLDFRITKFMVLEVVGALILAAIFIPLAQRAKSGALPRGRLWNFFEAMAAFVRNQIARPTIGTHDGDRYAPFLMTTFFFILICNLLGLIPWAGSPTGALATTGALAVITFFTVIIAGSRKMGPIGFWTGQVPAMELPLWIAIPLKPMIFAIEVLGMFIKHFVLAMRLLANMMAGHMVLAVAIAFIGVTASATIPIIVGVATASVFGSVALSLLELFVAFLQAYIFTFLAGLFIGMAVHPH